MKYLILEICKVYLGNHFDDNFPRCEVELEWWLGVTETSLFIVALMPLWWYTCVFQSKICATTKPNFYDVMELHLLHSTKHSRAWIDVGFPRFPRFFVSTNNVSRNERIDIALALMDFPLITIIKKFKVESFLIVSWRWMSQRLIC